MHDYAADAKVFKAFCDVNRLQILEQLRSGEKCSLRFAGKTAYQPINLVLSHENPV